MSGRGTAAQAGGSDSDDRALLDKLEGNRSLAELLRTLIQDLGVRHWEVTALIGLSPRVILMWPTPRAKVQLGDLGRITALLIRDGGMGRLEVGAWLRSRNHLLSGTRPLTAFHSQGFLPVHRAAEAAYHAPPPHPPPLP